MPLMEHILHLLQRQINYIRKKLKTMTIYDLNSIPKTQISMILMAYVFFWRKQK